MKAAAIALGLTLLAGACSTTKSPDASSTATTRRPLRCESVPADVVQAITTGLRPGASGLRFAQAVKSKSFKSVYFVSADVEGPGKAGKDDVATWATNRLESGALVFSVDSNAAAASDWGSAAGSDAKMTMADDGAAESQECVRAVASVAS